MKLDDLSNESSQGVPLRESGVGQNGAGQVLRSADDVRPVREATFVPADSPPVFRESGKLAGTGFRVSGPLI